MRGPLAASPVGVVSSDRHTVKPWFDQHLAQSPAIIDRADKGFALFGGRVDVVQGRRRPLSIAREHLISVTALRGRAGAPAAPASIGGCSVIAWQEGDFTYWRVSAVAGFQLASSRQHATKRNTTQGSIVMDEKMADLGELEREVMQLIWSKGEVTAETVRESLNRKPKESTVRTVLRRLEDKGYVAHTVSGRTFVFRAVETRRDVAARAVKHIVDWFCNGSVEEVLVGMADARMLDQRTLQKLSKRIDEAKGGK
jgi:predicted transcriptional regulator